MRFRRRLWLCLLVIGSASGTVLGGWALWHRSRPEQRYRRALAALEQSDLPQIQREIRELRNHPDFRPHVHLLQGGLLLRMGEQAQALEEFDLTKAEGELRVPALLWTGECLYRLGRLAEAQACMQHLVLEHPDMADARRWLAAIYYDLGAMNEAVAELDDLVRLRPAEYSPHHLLGQIHFDFERFPQAIGHYRNALARQPPPQQEQAILRDLGRALVREHEYAAALETLARTAETAQTLALAGQCQLSLGRPEQARELLNRARQINPEERTALLLDARMHLNSQQPELALAPLQKALQHDPHDYECRYQLALALRQLGRAAEYEAEIARMRESRALSLKLTELNNEATRRPTDSKIRDQLADVCQRLGKPELAAMWQRAAESCRQLQRENAGKHQ